YDLGDIDAILGDGQASLMTGFIAINWPIVLNGE
ncbi:unnamed protein product, partial [marine sediment metagenome]